MKSESEISRVLFPRRAVIIYLGLLLPTTSSILPDRQTGRLIAILFGLAADGVYRARTVTSSAVSSYLPVSPLPVPKPSAVYSLWHFPSAHAAWPLASILPSAARTFLSRLGNHV